MVRAAAKLVSACNPDQQIGAIEERVALCRDTLGPSHWPSFTSTDTVVIASVCARARRSNWMTSGLSQQAEVRASLPRVSVRIGPRCEQSHQVLRFAGRDELE